MVEAFCNLGCDLSAHSAGSALPSFHVHQRHSKLKHQLVKILEDANLITLQSTWDDPFFVRTTKSVSQGSAQALAAALVDKFPQHRLEHELLLRTGPKLSDCLAGHIDPLPLVFGDSSARGLIEDVYTSAPMFQTGSILLQQYLAEIMRRSTMIKRSAFWSLGQVQGGPRAFWSTHL